MVGSLSPTPTTLILGTMLQIAPEEDYIGHTTHSSPFLNRDGSEEWEWNGKIIVHQIQTGSKNSICGITKKPTSGTRTSI